MVGAPHIKELILLRICMSFTTNQKIILKLKGPKFFKSNWIKMPTNGKINFKVPAKLKKGTYKVSVFMDGETCKYNHPKVKVV